jgi:hypothetical protein
MRDQIWHTSQPLYSGSIFLTFLQCLSHCSRWCSWCIISFNLKPIMSVWRYARGMGYQPSPIESLVYEWDHFLFVSSQLPYSNINFSYGYLGSKGQTFNPACWLKNSTAPFLDSGPPTVCPSESIKILLLASVLTMLIIILNLWTCGWGEILPQEYARVFNMSCFKLHDHGPFLYYAFTNSWLLLYQMYVLGVNLSQRPTQ